MLTTTTSPFRARRSPRYNTPAPEPVVKPPPWIHTITGRGVDPSIERVQTFSVRQSSSVPISSPPMPAPRAGAGWGAHLVHSPAGRTPSQGATGCGGRNRSSPTGGAANGRPLNTRTPSSSTPATRPAAVSAIGALMMKTLPHGRRHDGLVQPSVFEVPHRAWHPRREGRGRRLRAISRAGTFPGRVGAGAEAAGHR